MAPTARMIWLCARVRYWLGRGFVCAIFKVIFAYVIEFTSIYFSFDFKLL